METRTKKRAFIYTRVSTLEQAKEGYSIGEQEERLKAYAEAIGFNVIKIYSDPAYSGSNMERPHLKEMVKQIEKGVTDVVLVYKLDRLSRSQRDTLYLIEEVFLKNEVDFISMNESFDTSTSFGRAMVGILSVFAQLEREQIRERSIMGRESRAKKGKWHGGGGEDRRVTGYDYIDGFLHINEYEAQCVKFIFECYKKGFGASKTLRLAKSKFPGAVRTETTVRKISVNPIYIGKIKHNGEIYQGLHEPIISEELFYEVQEIIKKRASPSNPFRRKYLLSGLLYCSHCGARMYGRSGGKLKDGTSNKYYSCYSRQSAAPHMIKDKNCSKDHEPKMDLENSIIDELLKLNLQKVEMEIVEKNDSHLLKTLKQQEKEIDKQLDKLIYLYSLDNIPMDVLQSKLTLLQEEKLQIQEHQEKIIESNPENKLADIKETISQLSEIDWDNEEIDIDEKRLIVAKLIQKISVSNDNIIIDWAF